MIETVPNPLQDKGVQQEIEERVAILMNLAIGGQSIEQAIKWTVKEAARWGIQKGFNMGWRLAENATVKTMRKNEMLLKQVEKGGEE